MPKEKSSRLAQRHFGVKVRVWILVTVLLVVLFVTHRIFPSAETFQPYSTANLKSKNYLNNTEHEPNPFDFCPAFGPNDTLGKKHGELKLSQSRLHLGSNARVNRVITRALAGQPVTISVLGGSVSACHGAGDDPVSPKCYPSRFFQWWTSVFPHPASELTNGAMRRTNSAYYGYCSTHHIPDMTDLVIIELDSDDSPTSEMMEHFEILIRSLLLRPDQPAVMLLGHFSTQVHQTHGFLGPDHYHDVVAQFYDIPHVSTKPLLYADYMSNPNSVKQYYADAVLANPEGHELLTDVLVSYFQSQICAVWDNVASETHDPESTVGSESHGLFGGVGLRKGVPGAPGGELDEKKADVDAEGNPIMALLPPTSNAYVPPLHVPPARINTRPDDAHPFEEIAPSCVSANDLINPLPPSLFYGSGWSANHPAKRTQSTRDYYWYSTLPLSKLRVPIQVGAGDIGVYFLEEPESEIGEGSAVECWVDDNYPGAKVLENSAQIGESTPRMEIIDHFVTRGSHFVECQLLGEEGQTVPAFKIIGIFAS
ncbi:Cap64 protein [Cylindrobasidium torrendii FP15055 ss-10]|uniref:Cap64 protein n=1 Tax=Cylindrobasidium torrendii FP15055 ss-10 TaxID=1314674 RepID=A0A0D7BFK0_9AGAR|nr:Cap64 protein [Cylindrobasidium torrendii FP15055 ss-10]